MSGNPIGGAQMTKETQSGGSCRAVILAAGKGTRMNSELPKVVMPLAGRAMILHVLASLSEAGVTKALVVVGYREDVVKETIGQAQGISVEYVRQAEQLGTGHAVLVNETALGDFRGRLLVTNGDMPLIRPDTFRKLLAEHERSGNAATVLSSIAQDPFGYGRLVRDAAGNLQRIIEEKDADESIRKIQEVNSGTYVFEAPEIFSVLRQVGTNNKQGEYYLPDAIALLRDQGRSVGSAIVGDPVEAMGANSPAELEKLEEALRVRS